MNTLLANENVEAIMQDAGFLEVVVAEGKTFTAEDREIVLSKLRELQIETVKVLIARHHAYSPPEDYIIRDMGSLEGITISKIAFYAPTPTAQIFSHLVGVTSLKRVPYHVFRDYQEAVA